MEKKKINLLVLGLLFICVVLLLLILLKVPPEASQCLSNPLDYLMEKTGAFCSCSNNVFQP